MSENVKYQAALQLAIEKTINEGYSIPILSAEFGKEPASFSQNNYEALYQIFSHHYSEPNGLFDLSKIKGTCLQCHSKMQNILLNEIGLKTELTIGYVNMFGQDFYKFENIEDIKERPTDHPLVKKIDIHVWLTLPSLEILDFTFLAHFHFVNADPEKKVLLKKASNFDFLFGSADRLFQIEHSTHHPLYIGKDVLIRNKFAG